MNSLDKKILALKKDLSETLSRFHSPILTTSLSIEDVLLHHLLSELDLNFSVVTIDTGRLPEETYSLICNLEQIYKKKIDITFPNPEDIIEYVQENTLNGFYDSPEKRKKCCWIRKVLPLKKYMNTFDVWITGLRSEDSNHREQLDKLFYDNQFKITKFNPLLEWSFQEVLSYTEVHHLPIHPFYKKGYTSIGCAPCTRPPRDPNNKRSGRWWWEDKSIRECGLHWQESN